MEICLWLFVKLLHRKNVTQCLIDNVLKYNCLCIKHTLHKSTIDCLSPFWSLWCFGSLTFQYIIFPYDLESLYGVYMFIMML